MPLTPSAAPQASPGIPYGPRPSPVVGEISKDVRNRIATNETKTVNGVPVIPELDIYQDMLRLCEPSAEFKDRVFTHTIGKETASFKLKARPDGTDQVEVEVESDDTNHFELKMYFQPKERLAGFKSISKTKKLEGKGFYSVILSNLLRGTNTVTSSLTASPAENTYGAFSELSAEAPAVSARKGFLTWHVGHYDVTSRRVPESLYAILNTAIKFSREKIGNPTEIASHLAAWIESPPPPKDAEEAEAWEALQKDEKAFASFNKTLNQQIAYFRKIR